MSVLPLPQGFQRERDGRLRPPLLFSEASQDAAFWDDGFFLASLLEDHDLLGLRRQFAGLRPRDRFDPSTLDQAPCTYHCTFLDRDLGYRRAVDELVRSVFEGPLERMIPGYEILTSNIYVKPPGVGRFEIHQNWPTVEDLDVPTLTVWMPLQDTTFRNGTIRVVRGSHHLFPDVSAASSDRFFDEFEQELIETYLEPIDVGAGEALVFDDSLLHWSGANLSDRPRVSFQIELIPTGVPAVLWIRAPDEPTVFDLWGIDKDYWLDYPFESVLGQPEGLPLVGRRANLNGRITFEQFVDAMRRGEEIRRSRYVLPDPI